MGSNEHALFGRANGCQLVLSSQEGATRAHQFLRLVLEAGPANRRATLGELTICSIPSGRQQQVIESSLLIAALVGGVLWPQQSDRERSFILASTTQGSLFNLGGLQNQCLTAVFQNQVREVSIPSDDVTH